MTANDRKRFSAALCWLAKKMVVPGEPKRVLTDDDYNDYFAALADVRIERIEWGARYIFAHDTFFPQPPRIREAAMAAPASVIPPAKPLLMIEDLTPPEVAQDRLRSIFSGLDEKFGTKLAGGQG